jgi:hypothetical protein
MTSLILTAAIIGLVFLLIVLSPFFYGEGGSLQDSSVTDSVGDLEARQDAILRRWIKDEQSAAKGEISPTEWAQRQRYLTSRYVDSTRRLAWLKGVKTVLVACMLLAGVAPYEASAQVTVAPKQLLVLKPGLDVVHGTWVVAIMNKGQAPAKFRTPVLMPLEARDFQPIEGATAEDVKLADDGLWVEKEFAIGVNVVSFAFVVPSSLGGISLSLKPRADTGELMIMTPKGMLDVTGRDFVESGTDVQEMQRYSVLSSKRLIVAGEELSLRVDGVPEGRGRLWVVGGVFGFLLVMIAGVLAWRSRPLSRAVAV